MSLQSQTSADLLEAREALQLCNSECVPTGACVSMHLDFFFLFFEQYSTSDFLRLCSQACGIFCMNSFQSFHQTEVSR